MDPWKRAQDEKGMEEESSSWYKEQINDGWLFPYHAGL